MKKWIAIALVLLAAVLGIAFEPTRTGIGYLRGEAFFAGRSESYWLNELSTDDAVRREAAYQKLLDGDASSVAVLRALLSGAGGAEVRWTSAELLGKKKGDARDAAPELIQALGDSDAHVRAVSATALPEVDAPAERAVPALIPHLRGDAAVPVIRALSRFGGEARAALPELVNMLQDRSLAVETRWNAARTIGKMRTDGADAIPKLVEALHDEESRIREHAAEALGDIGPPSRPALEALVEVLTDADVKVRRDAVRSIGQIGADASVIPAVEKLVKDPEAIVREAAVKTLEQLGAAKQE